jgi:hypothetical protein
MDVATKKRIEEQLRQLLMRAEAAKDENGLPGAQRSGGVQVIRRRKGSVERRVA